MMSIASTNAEEKSKTDSLKIGTHGSQVLQ